eukprot:Colp12_sorted_trinity150504_noHs@1126
MSLLEHKDQSVSLETFLAEAEAEDVVSESPASPDRRRTRQSNTFATDLEAALSSTITPMARVPVTRRRSASVNDGPASQNDLLGSTSSFETQPRKSLQKQITQQFSKLSQVFGSKPEGLGSTEDAPRLSGSTILQSSSSVSNSASASPSSTRRASLETTSMPKITLSASGSSLSPENKFLKIGSSRHKRSPSTPLPIKIEKPPNYKPKKLNELWPHERATLRKIALSEVTRVLDVPIRIPGSKKGRMRRLSVNIKKKIGLDPSPSKKDEKEAPAVFGAPLEATLDSELDEGLGGIDSPIASPTAPSNGQLVPVVVRTLIDHIMREGLSAHGVFRVSGNSKRMRQLKDELCVDKKMSLSEYNVHDVAGILKQYFRDLPEPLMTTDLYRGFLEVLTLQAADERIQALQLLCYLLPTSNADSLAALLALLHTVSLYSQSTTDKEGNVTAGNEMDSHNLALVFGPNILHQSSDKRASGVIDMDEQFKVVEVVRIMIEVNDRLFLVPVDVLDRVDFEIDNNGAEC